MDASSPPAAPPVEQGHNYEIPIVETYTAPAAAEQVIDRYEPYSIAATIHAMFAKAEQMEADGQGWGQDLAWERKYPKEHIAFQMFMKEVQLELHGSDAVKALRSAADNKEAITAKMVEDVFSAFERAVATAARRLQDKLRPDQLRQLKRAARHNLDWGYRDLLLERMTANDAGPAHYTPEDFFLILNPKARKVQYMERQEILKSLTYSMSLGTKDRLQQDVNTIRRYQAVNLGQEMLADSDLEHFGEEPN